MLGRAYSGDRVVAFAIARRRAGASPALMDAADGRRAWALLGAAHGHQYPDIGPLGDSDPAGCRRLPGGSVSRLEVRGIGDVTRCEDEARHTAG